MQLYWETPRERENGEYLDVTEIGGYDIRYKRKSAQQYIYVTIHDGYADAYYFEYLQGEYEFEIATFDTSGLYSSYVRINPY